MSADKDLISVQQARDLVEAAHRAQTEIARFDQAKIDRICEAMSRAALREAARLGAMAVEETGYGVADDKQEKNRFAAEDVWNYFAIAHGRSRHRDRKTLSRSPVRAVWSPASFLPPIPPRPQSSKF